MDSAYCRLACTTAHLKGFVKLSRGGQDKVQYS